MLIILILKLYLQEDTKLVKFNFINTDKGDIIQVYKDFLHKAHSDKR